MIQGGDFTRGDGTGGNLRTSGQQGLLVQPLTWEGWAVLGRRGPLLAQLGGRTGTRTATQPPLYRDPRTKERRTVGGSCGSHPASRPAGQGLQPWWLFSRGTPWGEGEQN